MRIRDRRIALCLDTRLEMGFALRVAVGAEYLALKILRQQPHGLPVGFGPLQHRRDLALILAVAKRGSMPDDGMFRLNEGLAVVALDDPMCRLHFRRFVIGDVTLHLFAPLPSLRLILGSEFLNASCLLL